ncbi:phosphate regulon sensor histidine kinase PhoR [Mesosutterella sp. OilRF-GAM-744-9]|uniref:Phosphate regulon sensor protein PhoR n=1 Tax=Mesosutterella porci TaxID=2915351 RepID=A0ABS9MSJ5_9BURK|nr:phosphate regulon sensor histidine kinase PhoR [Mesosutterella sp. oilRF-744-WT-GAM-9]MCG5031596.1 phosphate regulon sensor histidine kinase PhoR [Mesosutterella sp. oilRF-744-WT-GAM-9]
MNVRETLSEMLIFLGIVSAIFLTGLVFALSFDLVYGLAAALACSLLFLFIDFRRIDWITRWLEKPSLAEIPEVSQYNSWYRVLERLRQNRIQFEKNTKKMKSRETRYRRTLSTLPDGVVLIKTGWLLDWCNEAAEKQLGIDPETDHGRSALDIFKDTPLASYLEKGDFSKALMLTFADRAVSLEIRVTVLGRKNIVLLSHDVTERERLDSVRKDFVANVSHELRTPLTVISGFLELAGAGAADGKVCMDREHFALMQDQAHRMSNLVSDLLTLSRLEQGIEEPADDEIDMDSLLRQAVEEGRAVSGGHHEITWSAQPCRLKGNEAEVRSALANLVSNAVRYTPHNGHIHVDWKDAGAGRGLVLSVADDGIGIDPKDIPRITERFYRVDKSRSRDTGGTGLGLAIVKHIMIRHGGRLEIKSTPGKGSVFSMVFPEDRKLSQS